MRRRRGEVSLFEILREPNPAPEEKPKTASSKAVRGVSPTATEDELPRRGGVDPAVGSSTPSAEPPLRPRLDVTPPSRASRRLPELPVELSTGRSVGALKAPLPSVERNEPSDTEGRWWDRQIIFPPVVLGLSILGVLLSWVVLFQLGVGSAQKEQARLDQFSGEDNPGWEVPIIHPPPGRQPEVRNIVGPNGGPAEFAVVELPDGGARLPVLMVAQKLGRPENAEKLVLHIDEYSQDGAAHVTRFRDSYAVFIGPFDTVEEANDWKKSHRIPSFGKIDFSTHPYVHQLDFTPHELRLLGRG